MDTNTLTVQLVTSPDGTVDQGASTAAFQAALSSFVAEFETQLSTIAETVQGVFAKNPGKAIKIGMLASMSCAALNAQLENYSALEARILKYVRDNASDDRSAGKLFRIGKGRAQGGVNLWSQIPVAAPKASK